MSIARAQVPTTHAARYLQQLCKHWGHKFRVVFNAAEGHIDFGDGRACGLKATDAILDVRAIGADEALPQLQDIIERHIQRFAHREGELVFAWGPMEG
ncbi:MAG: DUF2218 domain-containing protein [Brevundimonas sp.]|uniref:DUF2218 domain-containing protein n=1 Tax=Brevundimonas sp. TaxID=1871086 RepID=UPI0025BF4BAF|nr:DUF2218 domain-containing protein [Brevundimonas sp.]MBX3477720.1 DUF2218 domain-containing protein [Brevundimonas sp.]